MITKLKLLLLLLCCSVMITLQRSLCSWKVVVCACLLLAVLLVVTMSGVRHMTSEDWFDPAPVDTTKRPQAGDPGVRRDFVNNSGALREYLLVCAVINVREYLLVFDVINVRLVNTSTCV